LFVTKRSWKPSPYFRRRSLGITHLGFGLGAGNWLSLLVSVIVPLLGLLPRIAVEESELVRVLGEPYRAYQRTSRRLIPGAW
jgi:protein-S-isoprenylcysteine O-methyltransferase Ste14